jgi:LmbE family N-acetylglucosaminyl deacetylase
VKKTILAVVAHPDDEVLGCGGTLARYASEGHPVFIFILGDGELSRGQSQGVSSKAILERRTSAQRVSKLLRARRLFTDSFPDNQFDSVPLLKLAKAVEAIKAIVKPQVIFTHHGGDLNVDHRLTLQAVLTACRPQPGEQEQVREIYSFEVPSSTEWNTPNTMPSFVPNFYINVEKFLAIKIKALTLYQREMRPFPHARSLEAIRALAAWRGASVGFRAAEAFVTQRILLR